MTWKGIPVPDEQCFEAIKAGIDALPAGAKMFLNGGEFYGHNTFPANLEMTARFFEKISCQLKSVSIPSDRSWPENLTRSVNWVNEKLRGTKRLDLLQYARVDPDVPVEVSIAVLARLKNEGRLVLIGMSEPFSYETEAREGQPNCLTP
ncbi:hypothetical protein J3R83DRAFT_7805 [Lanmaoa asiatica]|nr:hypothetical protein J3R83DRAFT_7805 [Lanmaoa asiatica]